MPATPAEYRRELARLLRTLDTQIDTYADAMEAILDDARRQIIGDLAQLDLDSPSRPMLARALAGVDEALTNMRRRLAGEMTAGTAATFDTGTAIATTPLGAEFTIAGSAVTTDTLAIASQFSAELIQDISSTARRRINAELTSVMVGARTPGEAAKAIGRNLHDPNHFRTIAHRARAIVVTELGRAQALGTQAAQQQLEDTQAGIGGPAPRKRWLNAHLPGARATHLEAEARYAPDGSEGPIPVRALFTVGGFQALYPRDPSLPARESVHCHCVSVTTIPAD
jgi:hypothetical protein